VAAPIAVGFGRIGSIHLKSPAAIEFQSRNEPARWLMPLTMRPTGLGHGVYKDIIDYGVFGGEWGIGRIYERRGFPDDVRFYCADSDDPGQGFQLKAATIPIEGGQYWPVGTFMGSQRW
jgi:hypothetical protein